MKVNPTFTHIEEDVGAICPKCGRGLAFFSSFFRKVCYNCKTEYPWELKDKQPPLIVHQR